MTDKKVDFALDLVGKSVIPKMYRRAFIEGNANYPRIESPIGAKCDHIFIDECMPPQGEIIKARDRAKLFVSGKEFSTPLPPFPTAWLDNPLEMVDEMRFSLSSNEPIDIKITELESGYARLIKLATDALSKWIDNALSQLGMTMQEALCLGFTINTISARFERNNCLVCIKDSDGCCYAEVVVLRVVAKCLLGGGLYV